MVGKSLVSCKTIDPGKVSFLFGCSFHNIMFLTYIKLKKLYCSIRLEDLLSNEIFTARRPKEQFTHQIQFEFSYKNNTTVYCQL